MNRSDRRTAIHQLGILLGISITPKTLLMAKSMDDFSSNTVNDCFPDHFYQVLSIISDTLLPHSDTPGALDADVPDTIRKLLAGWASPQTRSQHIVCLEQLELNCESQYGRGILQLTESERLFFVQRIDREAFDGDDLLNFIPLKRLILFTFFSSEMGATQALRFDPVPGEYLPCETLGEEDKAWYSSGFAYEL